MDLDGDCDVLLPRADAVQVLWSDGAGVRYGTAGIPKKAVATDLQGDGLRGLVTAGAVSAAIVAPFVVLPP